MRLGRLFSRLAITALIATARFSAAALERLASSRKRIDVRQQSMLAGPTSTMAYASPKMPKRSVLAGGARLII